MSPQSFAFYIIVSEKGGAERREPCTATEVSVGRVQGNDLVLPKGNVSKQHAKIFFRDGRFVVSDLNSTNGTYVNRRRIQQATSINEGDRIYIGDFVLRLEPGGGVGAGAPEHAPVPVGPSLANATNEFSAVVRPTMSRDVAPTSAAYPEVPAAPRIPGGGPPRGTIPSWSDHTTGRLMPQPELPGGQRVAVSDSQSNFSPSNTLSPSELDAGAVLGIVVESVLDVLGERWSESSPDGERRLTVERVLDEQLQRLAREGLTGSFSPERLRLQALAELLDLGPLGRLLDDGSVSEIVVPRFDQILVRRTAQLESTELTLSSARALNRIIARLCARAGAPLATGEFHVRRRLASGAWLTAALPPLAIDGPSLVLRRARSAGSSLQQLVRAGTISRAIASFLQQVISARLRVLIIGLRDAEPGAVCSAMVAAISDGPIAVLEGDVDTGSASAAVPLLRWSMLTEREPAPVVRAAAQAGAYLVASPDCAAFSRALLEHLSLGVHGALVLVEAPSIESALNAMSLDLAEASEHSSVELAQQRIAASFELIVEVVRYADGRQRVVRLMELTRSSDGPTLALSDVFTFITTSTSAEAVEGTFRGAGVVPRVVEEMLARGAAFDTSVFSRPAVR